MYLQLKSENQTGWNLIKIHFFCFKICNHNLMSWCKTIVLMRWRYCSLAQSLWIVRAWMGHKTQCITMPSDTFGYTWLSLLSRILLGASVLLTNLQIKKLQWNLFNVCKLSNSPLANRSWSDMLWCVWKCGIKRWKSILSCVRFIRWFKNTFKFGVLPFSHDTHPYQHWGPEYIGKF